MYLMGYTLDMLSLFPEILFLAPFSAFLIRVALALLLGLAAWKHFSHDEPSLRIFGILEIAAAAALLAGAWTQGVALLAFIGTALSFVFPRLRAYPLSTTLLALVMFLSLVVTGAGVLSFDLPL